MSGDGKFIYKPGGGTFNNPSGVTGPSWFTAPTKNAGVTWKGPTPDPVYMGGGRPYQADASKYFLTPQQAKAQLQGFNASQQALMKGAMATAGIKYTSAKAGTMWGRVIDYVQSESQNGNYLDPFSVLGDISSGTMKYAGGAPGSSGGSGAGSGPVTRSIHQTQVNLTNKTTGDRLIDDVLANYLGRTASDVEKANFLKTLNAKEKANPSVATGSSTTSRTSSSSSTTQSGGVDSQEVAIKAAQADKGYAEYQYGTTYMNAFLSALGAPVSAAGTV